jgi:hypothetical protein
MTSHDHHAHNASPKFRSIKALFEHVDVPPPRPFSRNNSKPSSPANEAPNPVATLISREPTQYQQDNIDAFLEAPSAPIWSTTPGPQLRPKSSWIGPPPPAHLVSSHSSNATMAAHEVTVTYSSPGLQPPVYITTSLSEPEWDLLEMDCRRTPNGEHEFAKTFHAAEGEYQYKFRLGPGDWWVCDESKPTVADGFGARNNVLVVKGDVPAKKHATEPQGSANDGAVFDSPVVKHGGSGHGEGYESQHVPLFTHEKLEHPGTKLAVPPENVPVTFSRQDTSSLEDDDNDDDANVESSRFSEPLNSDNEARPAVERIPTPSLDEDEDPMDEAPLMSHETLASPIDEAPLMPHETLSPTRGPHTPLATDHHHNGTSNSASSPTSSHSSAQLPGPDSHVPAEADPNDPSLIEFPTHHEGIISSLRRASLRMTDDEAKEEVPASTSPVTQSVSHSSQSPSLPSVREDEEELAEELEEEQEQETHAAAPDSKIHGLATNLSSINGSSKRPAALITPPGTPPDDSKARHDSTATQSDHHHKLFAEKDMQEESEHDVKHHETHDHQQSKAGAEEGSKPNPEQKQNGASKGAGGSPPKSSIFETVMGLGLFVVVGVGAAWMAFMMHDPIKDGGAALTGAS